MLNDLVAIIACSHPLTELFERLRAMKGQRTMLFITQYVPSTLGPRSSTDRWCLRSRFGHLTKYADLILFMKDGTIVEQGSHQARPFSLLNAILSRTPSLTLSPSITPNCHHLDGTLTIAEQELLAADGEYAALYNVQAKAFAPPSTSGDTEPEPDGDDWSVSASEEGWKLNPHLGGLGSNNMLHPHQRPSLIG